MVLVLGVNSQLNVADIVATITANCSCSKVPYLYEMAAKERQVPWLAKCYSQYVCA